MKRKLIFALAGLLILVTIAGCSNEGNPTVHPLPSMVPISALSQALPTSIPPGKVVENDDLRLTMKQAEITNSYTSEYGLKRDAPAGKNILWVNILIENIGQSERNLPGVEHFSVLYGTSEFKTSYGHRQGKADYSTLKQPIYQGQKVDVWLRFDVPKDANLQDLEFVYLPGSLQVNFAFPASGYSWADHPVFLWKCAQ